MQSNWQANFFRGVALDAWRYVTTPELTQVEAEFIERVLQVRPGGQILDVPCGNGRHSIALAGRGYQLTGIDQSEEFIAEAKAANPGVRWVLGDMRSLPWNEEFNGAFCFGNSFGYFDFDNAGRFLTQVARSLKGGARFVVDTGMVAESILPSLGRGRWHRLGGMLMLSENRYDPAESRLDIDYTFVRDGQVDTRPTSSYVLTAGEICRLHRSAGLAPDQLLGSMTGEPYRLGSDRLIIVSVKE